MGPQLFRAGDGGNRRASWGSADLAGEEPRRGNFHLGVVLRGRSEGRTQGGQILFDSKLSLVPRINRGLERSGGRPGPRRLQVVQLRPQSCYLALNAMNGRLDGGCRVSDGITIYSKLCHAEMLNAGLDPAARHRTRLWVVCLSLGGVNNRERNAERGSAVRGFGHVDGAVMSGDDGGNNGQAEPRATRFSRTR